MGKVIEVSEYMLTYGKETEFLNVFGGFKYKKDGNNYVIYSRDNKKLYYGSLFIRDNKLIIMDVKNDISDIIKEYIDTLIYDRKSELFENISLDKVANVEIIGQNEIDIDSNVILQLYDKTIPKPEVKVMEEIPKKSGKKSIIIFIVILIIIVIGTIILFFPQLIMGNQKKAICIKSYVHDKLNAIVNEEVTLVFNNKNRITDIDIITDYKFNNEILYDEFVKKSYYYQYMKEGDTYKLDDATSTYRVFSSVDTEVDFFLPTDYDNLIKNYESKGYDCKNIEMSD